MNPDIAGYGCVVFMFITDFRKHRFFSLYSAADSCNHCHNIHPRVYLQRHAHTSADSVTTGEPSSPKIY